MSGRAALVIVSIQSVYHHHQNGGRTAANPATHPSTPAERANEKKSNHPASHSFACTRSEVKFISIRVFLCSLVCVGRVCVCERVFVSIKMHARLSRASFVINDWATCNSTCERYVHTGRCAHVCTLRVYELPLSKHTHRLAKPAGARNVVIFD